jgi:uncharacterized protein (DUF39 family)
MKSMGPSSFSPSEYGSSGPLTRSALVSTIARIGTGILLPVATAIAVWHGNVSRVAPDMVLYGALRAPTPGYQTSDPPVA